MAKLLRGNDGCVGVVHLTRRTLLYRSRTMVLLPYLAYLYLHIVGKYSRLAYFRVSESDLAWIAAASAVSKDRTEHPTYDRSTVAYCNTRPAAKTSSIQSGRRPGGGTVRCVRRFNYCPSLTKGSFIPLNIITGTLLMDDIHSIDDSMFRVTHHAQTKQQQTDGTFLRIEPDRHT
jgi:hypothetical protein